MGRMIIKITDEVFINPEKIIAIEWKEFTAIPGSAIIFENGTEVFVLRTTPQEIAAILESIK